MTDAEKKQRRHLQGFSRQEKINGSGTSSPITPVLVPLIHFGNVHWREYNRAGIQPGGNTTGRECPPLISLDVGIRGSGYSRFCRSGIPTVHYRCHWLHPSRRYPAPLSRLMQQRVEVGAQVVHVIVLYNNQAKSRSAGSTRYSVIQ